jgi:predicted secreted protein
MARYFLSTLQIEGFRGINNQGDPLNFTFRSDCVNSVFAANGLGKSSAFEALAFAVKGVVPKLKRLPASEHPDDYYANQFHGTGVSTVSLALKPDDGSPEVTVTVTRNNATGKRSVTSPTGFTDPEGLLRSLDSDLAFLDHDLFMEFVSDAPLKRGRTFSGLLGLSQLSEFRQALEVLSNNRNLNTDLELDTLASQKSREQRDVGDAEASLRTAFRGFFSKEPNATLGPDLIAADAFTALKALPVVSAAIACTSFADVDFEVIRESIKKAEGSDKRDRLAVVLRSQSALQGLSPSSGEQEERENLRGTLQKHVAALEETRGAHFRELYRTVEKLYETKVWTDPQECPACGSGLERPLPDTIAEKLQQYQDAENELVRVHTLWQTSTWRMRMKNLEEAEALGVPLDERKVADFNRRLGGSSPPLDALNDATSWLDLLETKRLSALDSLKQERISLEAELPPSLVTLTQQVEHAANLQRAIKKLGEASQAVSDLENKLLLRKAWATFIGLVSDEFAKAEVKLSTLKTTALDNDFTQMYEQVTNNPEIVPVLKKANTSEELHLRLAMFYGLTDLSAATLLPESYHNALAICIYLSAVLNSSGAARFMVLDDVTSSFDAGHQWALMELIRTKIAYPENPNGPQVIILSHDGLLEKYFDIMDAKAQWHHQRLQGMPPKGFVSAETQDVKHLEKEARQQLSAGQTTFGMSLVRQCLEQRLLQIIRKLDIRVRLDFSIRDDRKMVGNCVDAIMEEIDLHSRAKTLILSQQQLDDLAKVHVPALVGNWVSHYATASVASLSPYVLLGVLDTINKVTECFMYPCGCGAGSQPRFYKNLTSKACKC